MAVVTLPALTPDASIGAAPSSASAAVALPGTPASDSLVVITNLGPCHVACKLGTTSAVTVTPSTGAVVLAGRQLVLAIGSNTYIAMISCGGTGTSSIVNLTTGN
jgi:hypothetical protein